jgi:hypothetical protein
VPKVFVSYRRKDASAITGWMYERLSRRYGGSVFRDIDSIAVAENFRGAIGKALRDCDIVIAVIGPAWLGIASDGKRRIDNDRDWVRAEIELSLQLGIPIIPVLVERAEMPATQELPDSLKDLAMLNALPLDSGADFDGHIKRLVKSIDDRTSKLSLTRVFKALLIPFPIGSDDAAGKKVVKVFGRIIVYGIYIGLTISLINA